MKTKILSILALLLMTVTQGAWAQTTADIGRVIAADGKMYKTVTLANKVSTASGVVAYVGSTSKCVCPDYPDDRVLVLAVNNTGYQAWGSTGCTHGGAHNTVASALTHLSGNMTTLMLYNEHISTSDGHHTHLPAYQCRTLNVAKPSGAHEWFWPSVGQWNLMVKSLTGSYADLSETVQSALTAVLNRKIQAAGAEAVPTGNTILSTSYDGNDFWEYSGSGRLYHIGKSYAFYFRAMFTMPASATNAYVVEYDANGGSGAPAAQSKTHGTALTLSSTVPTRDGYTFAGWATSAEGAVAYSAGGSYTTDNDVVLYAKWAPTTISSASDWDKFCEAVNGGFTYSGKTVKLTQNVGPVTTWMTGTFSGTFDGYGNTLTVGYSTSARYCAPFGTLGGTVKNLRVAGTVSTSDKNFGGIAAQVTSGKTATIQNCRVSTSFTSTLSGDNSSSSFVGVVWSGGTLNITGCAFTGSLTGSGDAFGGFLGYKEGTCSMTDCLFAPASVTVSTLYAGTFSRPSAPTITNCYFTRTFGGAQGMQARTIVKGDYVSTLSVTKGDATATYDVSGITVYSGGIDFNDGSTTTFYGGSGQSVSLALTAETRSGYQFTQYAASQGTLSAQTATSATLTMPAANSTANDAVTVTAQYFSGAGTQASPYLIASTTDWNNLSAAVNGGETYSGKYFKMTANVGTVSTTVGTSASAFNGTFDGNGHTLNVNISNSNADTRTAPFAWAGGSAVIKNLHVTGSLTNTARTSGIVGTCNATTQISSCRVSATISGGNHTSGISISGGQITNCLFDGKINGTASTAGFATYPASGTKITNCLFKPQSGSSIPSSLGCFYASEGTAPTLTNCYYTSTAGGTTAQGTDGSDMSAVQLVENLGPSNWKVVGGNAIPKVHPNLSGSGTQASPYLIASTTDWNNLVSAVNAGEAYSGNYFKMTANVGTVSTWMTGTFSGTFDGYGNTLTVDYTATSQRCGAFGYLGSASIQNLKVAGTISTAYQAAGGLATWCNEGASAYITNCRVSTIISSSVSGDGTHGGFVAYTDGKLYFTGCVFDGSLTGSTTNACSGFVYNSGWNGAAVSLTDCLLAPSSVTIGTGASATFVRGTAPTITNCYYTQTFGTAQGTQARTIAAGDYVSSLAISGDGTEYDVSGITAYSGGISFNDGSTTTFYGGSGQTVSLALEAETRSGYQFKQYAASQGSLSDQTTDTPTLTMPAANSTANDVVTISAQYDPTYNATFADGNDNDGWKIDPTQQIEGGTVTVSYEGENKVKSVTVKANPSTLAGLKAAINDASDLTDLNTKVLGKYVTATGNIQSTSEGAVGIIAYISKTAVDNSFADSRIFVIATENASNSAAQAPSNAAETTYNSTSDLNGYAVTNAWQALDGYNASKAGWNYSASRPDGASHWFVPSYGQWVLGGPSSNTISTVMRSALVSGALYAVSTGRNTATNDNSYCVDCGWWGMGSIQRIQGILVRAAFVY